MTKIITNDGKEVNIKYCEIEKFCMNEIMNNKEYLKEFKELKKNYNYFNAYFDYIFNNKKYMLCEPLLIPNSHLCSNDKYYYIMENSNEIINDLDYDFTIMNDLCVSIVKNPYEIEEGFFILEDGTMITNNFVERHLKTAKLILNSYLINSSLIYKKYVDFKETRSNYYYYIIDFLIKNIGIIDGKKYNNNIKLILNYEMLTKEQLNTIKNIKKFYNVRLEEYNKFNTSRLTYINK